MLQLLTGGGLGAVVDDPAPVLGGDLDGDGHDISNVGAAAFTDSVAVGIAVPVRRVHIHEPSSGLSYIHFTNTTTGATATDGFSIGLSSAEDVILNQRENKPMIFYTHSTERMRILESGELRVKPDGVNAAAILVSAGVAIALTRNHSNTNFQIICADNNPALRPIMLLTRARGWLGGPARVIDGDLGAEIISSQYDGNSRENTAGIRFWIDGATGDGVVPQAISLETSLTDTASKVSRLWIGPDGKIGFATMTPTAIVDINSDILRLRTAKTPATAGAAGNTGDICWDVGNIYVCVAANTWKKAVIAAW